jgi:hypothetical protein
MGVRYPNARLVKIHRTYTVEEIARVLGVHKHTVRRWEKDGLRSIDDHRPKLFRGLDVRRFLAERREKAKRPMRPGQMFCFKCRTARLPYGGLADLLPMNVSAANLRGMCECGTLMHRRVSHDTIEAAARNLTLTIPEGHSRLGDKPSSTVNADLFESWRSYANAQRAQ